MVQDRHGSDEIKRLPNAVDQFLGGKYAWWHNRLETYINNPSGSGPVQTLIRNYPLVETIVGHERGKCAIYRGEMKCTDTGCLWLSRRWEYLISPTRYEAAPVGAGVDEWSVAIPDSAGLGNFAGLHYCIAGMKADGVTRISRPSETS